MVVKVQCAVFSKACGFFNDVAVKVDGRAVFEGCLVR